MEHFPERQNELWNFESACRNGGENFLNSILHIVFDGLGIEVAAAIFGVSHSVEEKYVGESVRIRSAGEMFLRNLEPSESNQSTIV